MKYAFMFRFDGDNYWNSRAWHAKFGTKIDPVHLYKLSMKCCWQIWRRCETL